MRRRRCGRSAAADTAAGGAGPSCTGIPASAATFTPAGSDGQGPRRRRPDRASRSSSSSASADAKAPPARGESVAALAVVVVAAAAVSLPALAAPRCSSARPPARAVVGATALGVVVASSSSTSARGGASSSSPPGRGRRSCGLLLPCGAPLAVVGVGKSAARGASPAVALRAAAGRAPTAVDEGRRGCVAGRGGGTGSPDAGRRASSAAAATCSSGSSGSALRAPSGCRGAAVAPAVVLPSEIR